MASDGEPLAKKAKTGIDEIFENVYKPDELGEEHRWLAKLEGHYNVKTEFIHSEGGSSNPGTGRSTFTVVMKGRYLKEHFDDNGGFTGEATYGFNVKKGVFEHTWVDTMGTRISFHEGKGEVVDGKLVVTFNGTNVEGKPTRNILTISNDHVHDFVSYEQNAAGGWWRAMSCGYTRAA